jgi:carbon starvation protein
LLATLALIVVGIVWAGVGAGGRAPVELVAPALEWRPLNAPPIWPFLFVTVACGAVSGFHCLVASGTSSKQLRNECDAQLVGYGSMLTEGFLAVLVILAVAAGIGLGWPGRAEFAGLAGGELWRTIYGDWAAADKGLGIKIGAFVVGAANFLEAYGIHHTMAVALLGVMVASFAGTTLDTATRLQRYVIQELARAGGGRATVGAPLLRVLQSPHGATTAAVASAFLLALPPMPGQPWTSANLGKGGLLLWPLFGATNQLLGGLAFLVLCFWLWRRGKPLAFAAVPALFMLVMPAWAMWAQLPEWWRAGSWSLVFVAVATLALEVWMVAEAVVAWPRVRGVVEAGPDG